MAKRVSPARPAPAAPPEEPGFDLGKFECVHQIGGIRLGTLDAGGRSVRVAHVDTGAGFRFTVALDRGGDLVDAFHHAESLAYLSPVGLAPPSHAYHHGLDWLRNWAGGLVTTCGPQYIGGPRVEDGVQTSLHGHFSNAPAAVESLVNPDPWRGRMEMSLGLVIRDARMFGPVIEVRRVLRCTLGRPEVMIEDEVRNLGDAPVPHAWLYHVNLGYPLLDRGARLIYRGPGEYWQVPAGPDGELRRRIGEAAMNRLKRVPDGLSEHAGSGERGLIVESTPLAPARDGLCRVGLVNERRRLGLELEYSAAELPRLANWQHYGPRGSYVTGLEPFNGSLLGTRGDRHPAARVSLGPGESRAYRLTLRVGSEAASLRRLLEADGPVTEA